MANFTTLNLFKASQPDAITRRGGLEFLNLKSAFVSQGEDGFISRQSFDLVNLPSAFFRRGKLSLREALAHELAFRCIAFKALVVQDVIPITQKYAAAEWQLDDTHPALPILRNPNPDNTTGDLLAFVTICEDVFGVCYLEKLRNRTLGIAGLAPLDPRTVREIPKDGVAPFPMFWSADGGHKLSDIAKFKVLEGGGERELDVDDVVVLRSFDVRSPLAGHSSLYASMSAIGLEGKLDTYIDCYLTAGGPSGIFKVKNRTLTEEEAEDMQERIYRRYKLNGEKAGRSIVLDEDGEYQQIGGHLSELGNEGQRFNDQAAICSAFNIPGQLVQAYYAIRWGNQRAGQETALRQFWETNMSPSLTRYRSQLDKHFLSDFDGPTAGIKTRVFYDLSNVKALQEDNDKVSARYDRAYKSKAVTKNEYRAKLGLKPVEGGDFLPNDEQEHEANQARQDAIANGNSGEDGKKPPAPPPNGGKPVKKKCGHLTDETKAYDYENLKLARKPNELEMKQIGAIAKAQMDSKAALTAVVMAARADLVAQGIEQLRDLYQDYARLRLEFPSKHLAPLSAAILDAINEGRGTIAKQSKAQPSKSLLHTVKTLLDSIIGSLTVNITSRLVNAFALRLVRGDNRQEAAAAVAAELNAESAASYEALAAGVAFQAVANGRKTEANAKGYERVYYSAILDVNTCEPCGEEDETEATDDDDLTPVPNPNCEGRWRCRCVHVYVFAEV